MCARWRFEVNVNERRVILGLVRIQDRGRGKVARVVVVGRLEGCQTETNVALAGRETGPGMTASVMMLVGKPGNNPIPRLRSQLQQRPRKPSCDTDLARPIQLRPVARHSTSTGPGRFIAGPEPSVTSAP